MSENDPTRLLDDLLDTLELKSNRRRDEGRGDAISSVLNGQPRTTAVVSLRDAPAVDAFRQALVDGLIRVDTANRLLRLVNEIIVRLVP